MNFVWKLYFASVGGCDLRASEMCVGQRYVDRWLRLLDDSDLQGREFSSKRRALCRPQEGPW